MKSYFLCFLLLSNLVYAGDAPLPSLGSCDEYTDYYIYKCMPQKCTLQIGAYQGVYREMETLGYDGDVCIHNIRFMIRNKAAPSTDYNLYCKLSENGRLEMANLFTRYKKGEVKVYVDTIMSKELKKECSRVPYN
jgi:hypothetical protein